MLKFCLSENGGQHACSVYVSLSKQSTILNSFFALTLKHIQFVLVKIQQCEGRAV